MTLHHSRSTPSLRQPVLTLALLGAGLLAACSSSETREATETKAPAQPAAAATAPAKPAAPAAPAAPATTATAKAAPAAPAAAAAPAAPAAKAAPAAPAATPAAAAAARTEAKAEATAATASAAASASASAAKAEVGQAAPDFTLTDTAGASHTLSKYAQDGKIVVIEWFNPDCPITRKYHAPTDDMMALADAYHGKVVWLAINSGAAGAEGAGLERNRKAVAEWKLDYPVLIDEAGTVGKTYSAKTTPHMYVIDTQGVLRYAGAIDDGDASQKGKLNYVRQAVDELLAGKPVTTSTSKPFGCSVKYARPQS